jgi:transcriptional adapter 3
VVVATNQARKERLTAIARDRLGYQEYIELRHAIDKNITTLFSKLQKKDVPKLSKKKKKPLVGAAAAAAAAAAAGAIDVDAPPPVPPCPAALGLTPDEENRLTVNDQLKQLVETRRQWVDTVGAVFEEKQRLNPGRIWGFPKESIYKGIEEEVREKLLHASMVSSVGTTNGNEGGTGAVAAAPDTAIRINGNGKHKARGDEMDIG